jgi:hypothetical protein
MPAYLVLLRAEIARFTRLPPAPEGTVATPLARRRKVQNDSSLLL